MRRVCGLDVHKDSIYMCILYENGSKIESVFGVLTPELDKLRDLLVSHHVCEVALESTSIYWIPIWNILSVDFSLKLVNPYFIKQLPGRKSDVKDAEWIATVLQKGLIRGSYVPDRMIQCLRQYERRNHELSKNIVHAEQRMDMTLQRCNIRISNYVSCISCKGYQKVVNAIISGESNPKVLVTLIHKRTLNKHGRQVVEDSLNGFVSDTDRDILRQYRDERMQMEQHKSENKAKMQAICEAHYCECGPVILNLGLLAALERGGPSWGESLSFHEAQNVRVLIYFSVLSVTLCALRVPFLIFSTHLTGSK